MIKEIVTDMEFLKVPSAPATADDAEVAQDLIDTMAAQENCACLAANQIGVQKCVIVYDDNGTPRVMYNPRMLAGVRAYQAAESCLSLEFESNVKRFFEIQVVFDELVDGALVNRKARLKDWEAQVVQHAIDHCKGKLV